MKISAWLLLFIFCALHEACAQQVIVQKLPGAFPIVAGTAATILFDIADDSLIARSALLLQQDVQSVTGKKPGIITSIVPLKNIIIIGSIQRSSYIRQLVASKKIKVEGIRNQWEAYQVQVVKNPFKGVNNALVIAGSDRRGTAYGVMEISKQMGVSPWYWWADVPVKKKTNVYFTNSIITDAPKVKYRGIFINDEAPALSNWSKEKFGGFNHHFYEKVFELMLRLKANYLWPAMWGSAFYDDDSLNKQVADNYGIVIGTSHHEPLMRAHDEWRRYGKGKWNYDSNATNLQQFWTEGMKRVQNTETIATIGMRGDGDEPMSAVTATALLERIVKDQRAIIQTVTGKPADKTPQLWALYKEVQNYYDKGMRVPDDVTLLLCDDNWGNIRKLPKLTDKPRTGGYGIYYHFDYVGGPRNYKWINTNNLARVWEQMHLAWAYNARQIWIVNVGDIKPMELPTSFFLDYAWNPDRISEDNLNAYYTKWAGQQFGSAHAKAIGSILKTYAQYSARRKPELLDANTYSLSNYNEAEIILHQWQTLERQAEVISKVLPAEYHDAFFQLVLHPLKALANLHYMYIAAAKNKQAAALKDTSANEYAKLVRKYFDNDSLITLQYHALANGKWNHMMSQTHIGYTYWQQPPFNKMPQVEYVDNKEAKPRTVEDDRDVIRAPIPKGAKGNIFYEEEGVVSMEAAHWTSAINSNKITWKVIPSIGRTADGITTFPVTVSSDLSTISPRVEYEFYSYDTGKIAAQLYFSPTLNFHNNEGLQYAISIDDETPQVIAINKDDNNVKTWEKWVADNIIIKRSLHHIAKPGKHILKYWMISPAVVLQKLVVDFGNIRESYLGPPETKAN